MNGKNLRTLKSIFLEINPENYYFINVFPFFFILLLRQMDFV